MGKTSNVKETFLITFDPEVCIITLLNYLLGLLVISVINIEKWNKTTSKTNCCINLSSFLCCPFGLENTQRFSSQWFSPHERAVREPRSGEHESRSGERKETPGFSFSPLRDTCSPLRENKKNQETTAGPGYV